MNILRVWDDYSNSLVESLGQEVAEPPRDEYQGIVAKMVWRALQDLKSTDPETQQDAFWWVFVDRGEGVFSLRWCCDMLGQPLQEIRVKAEAQSKQACWRLAAWFATRAPTA